MGEDFPVEKVGSCIVVTLNRGENRVNNSFISALHRALDKAERQVVGVPPPPHLFYISVLSTRQVN